MEIYILANKSINGSLIAEHLFREERIIDRFAAWLSNEGADKISIISDKNLNVKNTTYIGNSKIDLKDKRIIDLSYVYDSRKLKVMLKKEKINLKKAVMFTNESKVHLDSFGCLYGRSEWNPISQYYLEGWGEKISFLIRNTHITPNFITAVNIIFGLAITSFLFLEGKIWLILFAISIQAYHLLDVVDGQLARLKGKATVFGKWLDCAGDRFVIASWYIAIALSLYFKEGKVLFLFAAILVVFGMYIYQHLLLTSVAYFRDNKAKFKSKSPMRTNIVSSFALLFINGDIHYYMVTGFVLFGRMDLLLFFYTAYYNFMWLSYFLFYSIRYWKYGDIKEL